MSKRGTKSTTLTELTVSQRDDELMADNGMTPTWRKYTYTHSASYPAGGDPCSFGADFPNQIIAVITPNLDDTFTYMPVYIASTEKMAIYKQKSDDTFQEATASGDMHLITYTISVYGY